MGWVAPDDGFLALDRNGDGTIDDVGELFGAGFVLPSIALRDKLPEDESGFATLGELDSNFDGVIDAGDAQFADLLVWQDANGDGVSAPLELVGLSDLDIASIDLDRANVNETLAGNQVKETSTFTRGDATTGEIADVFFQFDPLDTSELDAAALDPAVAGLPGLTGFGEVSDLQVAMSADPLLAEMVAELAALTQAEAHTLASKIEAIIPALARGGGREPAQQGAERRWSALGGHRKAARLRVSAVRYRIEPTTRCRRNPRRELAGVSWPGDGRAVGANFPRPDLAAGP